MTSANARDFNDEQYQALDQVVGENFTRLQQDADHEIDLVDGAVNDAFKSGAFGQDRNTVAVRDRIVHEGNDLKTALTQVHDDVAAARGRDRDPVIMLRLLCREQGASQKFYRWLRNASELAGLAWADAHHGDGVEGKFLNEMIQTHEAIQDTTQTSIEGVVGFINP